MSKRLITLAVLALAVWAAGCSGDDHGHEHGETAAGTPSPSGSEQFQSPPSRTLPIPGQETPGSPRGGGAAAGGKFAWKVPDDWEEVQPANTMRIAQYRVGGPGGDAECVVYYFGPGQGGDPMSNATRWAGQFEQPDGSSSVDVLRVSELTGTRVAVQLVEVTGTYDGGLSMTGSPPEKKPGHMLLGGIAEGPDAPWFFKLTGPESTVRAQKDAFVGMMQSIGGSG